MARALSGRVARIERTVGVPSCRACAQRPALGTVFQFDGRTTDVRGRDIPPEYLLPCPACGKGGLERLVEGVDPTRGHRFDPPEERPGAPASSDRGALAAVRVIRGLDPSHI